MNADAIVVGSGFGGAVAAARLAQAGFDVTVLERGRRWAPGSFPRTPHLDEGWLWQESGGLYDIRWLDRMASVQAAGWGGGSLVYANVFARPPDAALSERWPAHLRRAELDPYYDLAAHMIGVAPAGNDPRTGQRPARAAAFERTAVDAGIADAVFRPNLAVTFGDPDRWSHNVHGVPRRGCSFVGECILGCNHGAKNSLDTSYLAVAEVSGARAETDTEAVGIRPIPGGYAVTCRAPSRPDRDTWERRAPRVFLAAGAVATTELLLRARDREQTLPHLSPLLGSGFSGNGDYLATAQLARSEGDLTTGPTITTSTVLDVPEGAESVWFQVQDGAYPPLLAQLVDDALPLRSLRRTWQRVRRHDPRRRFAILAMGRDSAEGVLRLDRDGDTELTWRNRWQAHLHRAQGRVAPLIARQLRARVAAPISWSLFRRGATVHPLGGVPTGDDRDSGVVDEVGEVHGHRGLYVVDGAAIPASTGVNPSATIVANAERALERIIRDTRSDDWRAPEWGDVTPAEAPEDAAFDFMARRRAATSGGGIRFFETMRGDAGETLALTVQLPSIDAFLADATHGIRVSGTLADADAQTRPVAGTLRLFPERAAEAMRYTLHEPDTGRLVLDGVKRIRSRMPWGLAYGLTSLRATVRTADGDRRVRLRIGPRDLLRLVGSLRADGFTLPRRMGTLTRFARFFAASALAPQR